MRRSVDWMSSSGLRCLGFSLFPNISLWPTTLRTSPCKVTGILYSATELVLLGKAMVTLSGPQNGLSKVPFLLFSS